MAIDFPRINIETGEHFEAMTDEALVDYLNIQQVAGEMAQNHIGHINMELMRRAAERGATTIYGKGQNFVVTQPNEYDRTKLPPLLELLDPEAKGKCFIPAHQETVDVPDKWDMTQVKKYAKARGNEALDIVERATFAGRASGKLVTVDTK